MSAEEHDHPERPETRWEKEERKANERWEKRDNKSRAKGVGDPPKVKYVKRGRYAGYKKPTSGFKMNYDRDLTAMTPSRLWSKKTHQERNRQLKEQEKRLAEQNPNTAPPKAEPTNKDASSNEPEVAAWDWAHPWTPGSHEYEVLCEQLKAWAAVTFGGSLSTLQLDENQGVIRLSSGDVMPLAGLVAKMKAHCRLDERGEVSEVDWTGASPTIGEHLGGSGAVVSAENHEALSNLELNGNRLRVRVGEPLSNHSGYGFVERLPMGLEKRIELATGRLEHHEFIEETGERSAHSKLIPDGRTVPIDDHYVRLWQKQGHVAHYGQAEAQRRLWDHATERPTVKPPQVVADSENRWACITSEEPSEAVMLDPKKYMGVGAHGAVVSSPTQSTTYVCPIQPEDTFKDRVSDMIATSLLEYHAADDDEKVSPHALWSRDNGDLEPFADVTPSAADKSVEEQVQLVASDDLWEILAEPAQQQQRTSQRSDAGFDGVGF